MNNYYLQNRLQIHRCLAFGKRPVFGKGTDRARRHMTQDKQQDHAPNFGKLNGVEIILDYGSTPAEAKHLRDCVGVLNLSSRGRICLLGKDRHRFLNGQVTNDVAGLAEGAGCYTLITNRKGIIQGDAAIYRLPEEILLDLEPGTAKPLTERFQKFTVADDVEIVDAAPHFGLLSIQGPLSNNVLKALNVAEARQLRNLHDVVRKTVPDIGECYFTKHPRTGIDGYDIFVPQAFLEKLQTRLLDQALPLGGGLCGWKSLETLRIEAGIPRHPVDTSPAILAPELGREEQTISYSKGCYIGQEVINRIRSVGRINRRLVGIVLDTGADNLSGATGSLLNAEEKSVGFLTSTTYSYVAKQTIGLAFVKRGFWELGTSLHLKTESEISRYKATVSKLPFAI